MGNLWSIRMRASKFKTQSPKPKSQNSNDIHISGAEGLYKKSEVQKIARNYIERALNHPRGKADRIAITIEDIKRKPRVISSLPLATVSCSKPVEGKQIVRELLQSLGISGKAVDVSFELIKKGNMRGAAIITAEKGERLEPDLKRGVRASRLGIDKSVSKMLSLKLSRLGIGTDTVREALILASKVASCTPVMAEVCVSDDPDYTTGYVASRKFGYLRIPNIKHTGSKSGGRAFFIRERSNVKAVIDYLERMPVIIERVASCRGTISVNEIINRPDK